MTRTRRHTQTMNGQQNANQYQWTQFTSRLGRDRGDVEPARNDETAVRFDDVEVSTPRRGATSTRDFERRRRAIVVRFQDPRPHDDATPAHDDADDAELTPAPAHEPGARPRTRSARRAADDAAYREATAPPPAPTPTPTLKRERRSDYWVARDDKRRTSARTFKTQQCDAD